MKSLTVLLLIFSCFFFANTKEQEEPIYTGDIETLIGCIINSEVIKADLNAFYHAVYEKDNEKIRETLFTLIEEGNEVVLGCIRLIPGRITPFTFSSIFSISFFGVYV